MIKDVFKFFVPHQRWPLAAWLLMATAFFFVNLVGVTETGLLDQWTLSEPYDIRRWGWPFVYFDRRSDGAMTAINFSLYFLFVDSILCALMLACSGNFLESYAYRWIKNRQWTLGDGFLMITAAVPFLSIALLVWDVAPYTRHLPAYVMLPIMFGLFCTAHCGLRLVCHCVRSGCRFVRDSCFRCLDPRRVDSQTIGDENRAQPGADERTTGR
jgi:hypothetical protein